MNYRNTRETVLVHLSFLLYFSRSVKKLFVIPPNSLWFLLLWSGLVWSGLVWLTLTDCWLANKTHNLQGAERTTGELTPLCPEFGGNQLSSSAVIRQSRQTFLLGQLTQIQIRILVVDQSSGDCRVGSGRIMIVWCVVVCGVWCVVCGVWWL